MDDYASRQRKPTKHLIGLGLVVVLHLLLFWAISSGLARAFVKKIKGPVEAVLLEDAKPDIPPPPPPSDHQPLNSLPHRKGFENFGSVVRLVSVRVWRKATRAALSAGLRLRRRGTPLGPDKRLSSAGPA